MPGMTLESFDEYLLRFVFNFCDAGELVMLSRVNKHLYKLCRRSDMWKHVKAALEAQGFAFNTFVTPLLYGKLLCCDFALQLQAASTLRKLLSIEASPPIREVVGAGVVPKLVEILRSRSDSKLVFESAWALTNIASGDSSATQVVLDSGALPVFVSLLSECSGDVKEQAVWAIGNISGDSTVTRDMVLRSGVTEPLLKICDYAVAPIKSNNRGFDVVYTPPLSLLRNTAWCISNLCRGKTPRPFFEDVEPFIPALRSLINMADEEIIADSAWAFSYISDDDSYDNFRIQAVLDSGVLSRVVSLLYHDSVKVVVPVLRTIGNIVTGADTQTQMVINSGALDAFLSLLSHSKKSIRKETAWTISNITAGTSEQIQSVLDAGILPQLVKMLAKDDPDVKKECAWAVGNMVAGGTHKQIRRVAASGALEHMLTVLSSGDQRVMECILEAFSKIMRTDERFCERLTRESSFATTAASEDGLSGDGVRRILLSASSHYSPEVARLANQILNEYFVM